MQLYATVSLFMDENGTPHVRLEGNELFEALSPMHKATSINAALQLCASFINGVIRSVPDESEEIVERLHSMSLIHTPQVVN